MKKALIIGGGIGGCTAIYRLKEIGGWSITLVHPDQLLGGGVRTRFVSGHPATFGPRHFLTQNEDVFSYLNQKIPMRICAEHEFVSYVDADAAFYSYPIHVDDIPRMPEADQITQELSLLEERFKEAEYRCSVGDPSIDTYATDYEDFWIKSVGPTLYKKFIEKYTKKMWLIDDNKVLDDFTWSPKGVAIKSGPRAGWDTAISAYPIALDGYNSYFDQAKNLVDNFFQGVVSQVQPATLKAEINGEFSEYDLIINTAALDDIFPGHIDPLEYIGRKIEFIVLPVENALPPNVYFAYYTGDEPYTRVVEYKKFSKYASPNTLVSLEYPQKNSGKYYPVPVKSQQALHRKYLDFCNPMHFNAGRMALYTYRYDIDDVVEQVLDFTANL